MKKTLLLMIAMLTFGLCMADVPEVIKVDRGIKLYVYEHKYVVEFTPPELYEYTEYAEPDTIFPYSILDNDTNQPDDENSLDFDTYDLDGYPELPYYMLMLQVPQGTTGYSVTMERMDGITLDPTDPDSYFSTDYYLESEYLPAQSQGEDDDYVSYEGDYYMSDGSGWHDTPYECGDISGYMGLYGFNFTLNLLRYYPCYFLAREYAPMRFTITIDSPSSLIDMRNYCIANCITDAVMYSNYDKGELENDCPACSGNYAIVTTDYYIPLLTEMFIPHKEQMGCHVTLYPLDYSQCTKHADSVLVVKKRVFDAIMDDSRYVLLVGHWDSIPYSGGSYANKSNPTTDYHYNHVLIPPFLISTHMGRWPVRLEDELYAVIEKTKNYELNAPSSGRVQMFSGTGKGKRMFYKANRKVRDKVLKKLDIQYVNTDGRGNDGNLSYMVQQLNRDSNFVFLYRGHGGTDYLCDPYNLDADSISTSISKVTPFMFSVACLTNVPNSDAFGCRWIVSLVGGCTFFGASAVSGRSANNCMQKKIFKQLKCEANISIGEMIDGGMYRYEIGAPWRGKQVLKYSNFLGDPSLKVYGANNTYDNFIGSYDVQNVVQQRAAVRRRSIVEFDEPVGRKLSAIYIYDLMGRTVFVSKGAEDTSYLNARLPAGIYLLQRIFTDGTRLTKKIIVNQH